MGKGKDKKAKGNKEKKAGISYFQAITAYK